MSRSEGPETRRAPWPGDGGGEGGSDPDDVLERAGVRPPRYGRYLGFLGALIILALAVHTLLSKQTGVKGIEPGSRIPPFALPLASGTVEGDADVATHADDGAAGKTPACSERGAGILNVCELYERGPLVLALFVDEGSCPGVLDDMQALASEFPGVGFAGVAIKGERRALRALVAKRGLSSVEVGFDGDGVLAGLYKLLSCPQVSFVLPGGAVQSPALLSRPPRSTLLARVQALVAEAKAHGWRAPG